jgi:hypothetical protein
MLSLTMKKMLVSCSNHSAPARPAAPEAHPYHKRQCGREKRKRSVASFSGGVGAATFSTRAA